jgi:hypothetical protein
LELARRHLVAAVIAIAAVATTATAVALRRRSPEQPVASHAYAIPSAENRVIVEVLNGTGQPGRARGATRLLRRHGLDVVFFGNWDGEGLVRKTKVVVRRGIDQGGARRVAAALGAGTVVVDVDTLRRVDVTVILGTDWAPPAGIGL